MHVVLVPDPIEVDREGGGVCSAELGEQAVVSGVVLFFKEMEDRRPEVLVRPGGGGRVKWPSLCPVAREGP